MTETQKEPSAEGKRRYSGGERPHGEGYYDGIPCTCRDDCPPDCRGQCGCEACRTAYGDFLSTE